MQEMNRLLEELHKAKAELSILYEISNVMHTTLKLDEILYIILTGVTAHSGLGFNRAMLLLLNSNLCVLEGKMGIGPDTAEGADSIWRGIETEKMNLEELSSSFSKEKMKNSKFNCLVESISIPCDEKKGGILAVSLNDGMSLHITKDKLANLKNDPLLIFFNSEDFVITPLKAKDKVIGLIVVDNFVTHEPITNDDIRMLTMFANQAGLAIEKSSLYEKVVFMSNTDSLTELWNHAYFQQILEQQIAYSREEGGYLSLIMIDLDDFKVFNDTWGHQKGDAVLVQIAKLFKEVSRKLDYICRYGGEEFSIILPKTNLKDAMTIAERIHSGFSKYNFEPVLGISPQKISLSLGVATFPIHAQTKSELIQVADQALYQAKKQGKNKVVSFSN